MLEKASDTHKNSVLHNTVPTLLHVFCSVSVSSGAFLQIILSFYISHFHLFLCLVAKRKGMIIKMKKLCTVKVISMIILGALFLSLIPIVMAAFYSHPTSDDFGYSLNVYNAVNNGGNIIDILSAAIDKVITTYFTWQGTFSAVFIFSLQPAAFSDNLYFLTTIIILGMLIFSNIFFIQTVVVKLLKNKKEYGFIISGSILFMSIQFVIDKTEAFYWWNGSTYYSLFYSFSLIFFACIIRLYLSDNTHKKILFFIISSFLSIIIGGGNFTTALTTSVIMFLVEIYIIKTKAAKNYMYHIVFALLIISFLISMVAPGNNVRAESTQGMSVISSIFYSLFYSFTCISSWTQLPQIVLFLFLAPILYKISKSIKYDFKYPLLAIVLSFLVFATQLTPSLFAMSSIGSGRQVNIYYYFYYIVAIFDIFYICGWLNNKEKIIIKTRKTNKLVLSIILFLTVIFSMGCFQYGIKKITTVDTTLALKNGTVIAYDSQYKDIIARIKSGENEVNDISCVPDFFKSLNLSEDPDYWVNKQLENYFGIDKIILK